MVLAHTSLCAMQNGCMTGSSTLHYVHVSDDYDCSHTAGINITVWKSRAGTFIPRV